MPRLFGWASATVVCAIVIMAAMRIPDAAETAQTPAAAPFRFHQVSIDTSGDAPQACFHFTEALDPRAEAHYGDYLAVDPALTPAIRARGNDLCLAGLAYGTDYKVTLRKGLPARSGARTEQDETIEVSLGDRPSAVALSGDGFILPRVKGKGLTVETVNVSQVKIHVLRMSDRLLPSQIRSNGPGYEPQAEILKGGSLTRWQLRELLARNWLSPVWSGTMEVQPDHNAMSKPLFHCPTS
jgi:alpha-2-macroglobulin